MNFTMAGARPTVITEGLGGNSWNSQHLVRTYGVDKPHDLSTSIMMSEMFSATDRYQDKPLIGMTEAKGKKLELTSNQFTWKLVGHQKIKARIVEVVETASQPGLNQSTFDIVLDRAWYKYPDVLTGNDAEFPIEIVPPAELTRSNPQQFGTGWRYTVRLQTDDNSRSIPVNLIQAGQEFWKTSTSVSDEMNQDYGTLQFNTIFELRGQMGNVGEQIQVTDKMLRVDKNSNASGQPKFWRVPFIDAKGKKYTNFMPLVEATLWNQIYEDIEWGLNYGRRSITTGSQGYLKRTGAGLRQQLEDGNTLKHSGNLTLSQLDEWLSSIYRGRKDASPSSRKIVLSTGERGARMFDSMVATEASAFYADIGNLAIQGSDVRHLSYGIQFTHYKGKNGLDVTVMLDPNKDNPTYNGKMHPNYPDTTQDSWRMDILDFGTTSEQSVANASDNIVMVSERYADHYFTTVGKWNKATGMPINDGSVGNAGGIGGYSCHIEKSFGLLIKDITRCGSIQLSL